VDKIDIDTEVSCTILYYAGVQVEGEDDDEDEER
jgi:hypothetical protein